jgi:uncharacterized protein Yka (UPF0111/DUF47 family)
MSNLQDALKQLEMVQNLIKKTGNIADKIQDSSKQAKTKEEKELINELAGEYRKTMKEAEKGNIRDLSVFVNKVKNMGNNGD